jgi:hypothetical protein
MGLSGNKLIMNVSIIAVRVIDEVSLTFSTGCDE